MGIAFGSIILYMKVRYKPNTVLGIWSVRLLGAAILFFILFFFIVASGQKGGETFFSNLSLTIPMLVAFILAVCAFITGLISTIRDRERAVIVFLSTMIGLFILIFGIAEVVFPH